ncbi:MAG: hypothetical protein ACI865_003206 [Flavobacteriaceae bacterium]|jgi:hypothetical protein
MTNVRLREPQPTLLNREPQPTIREAQSTMKFENIERCVRDRRAILFIMWTEVLEVDINKR